MVNMTRMRGRVFACVKLQLSNYCYNYTSKITSLHTVQFSSLAMDPEIVLKYDPSSVVDKIKSLSDDINQSGII